MGAVSVPPVLGDLHLLANGSECPDTSGVGVMVLLPVGSGMVELLLVGSGMLELLSVGSGVVGQLTTEAGVAGRLTTEAGVAEWLTTEAGVVGRLTTEAGVVGRLTTEAGVVGRLTTEVGVVEWLDGDVGAIGKLSMSPSHSSMVDVFPAEESSTWTGATDALPPITASISLKKVKSDVGTSSSSDSRPWPLLLSLSVTSLYFLFRALIFVRH